MKSIILALGITLVMTSPAFAADGLLTFLQDNRTNQLSQTNELGRLGTVLADKLVKNAKRMSQEEVDRETTKIQHLQALHRLMRLSAIMSDILTAENGGNLILPESGELLQGMQQQEEI